MNAKLKEFLKTGKGKLLVACGALLISWIFLLTQLSGSFSSWFPDEGRKEGLRREIKKFDSAEALKEQITKDIETAKNV